MTPRTFLTAAALVALTASPALADLEAGTKMYKARCVVCHAADGSGKTAVGQKRRMRDLRSPEVQKQVDAVIGARIKDSGESAGLQAHRNRDLKPEEVRDLVLFIRSIAAE